VRRPQDERLYPKERRIATVASMFAVEARKPWLSFVIGLALRAGYSPIVILPGTIEREQNLCRGP